MSSRQLKYHIKKVHNILDYKMYYDEYRKQDLEGICPTCGNSTPFISKGVGYYQKHCSCKCAQNNPNVYNHFRDNNPQKDEKIRQRTYTTNYKKYGCKIPTQNKEIKNKAEKTNMKMYGVKNIYQIPEIVDKAIKNSHTEKANNLRYKTVEQNKANFEKLNDCTRATTLIKLFGTGWYEYGCVNMIIHNKIAYVKNKDIPIIEEYSKKIGNRSLAEIEIYNLIKEIYSLEIISNTKKILKSGKELDIYLPEIQLAIEFNGLYYHSIEKGISKSYHLNKSIECRNQGIRLIHIYEFEDINKQKELLKDLILFNKDNYNPFDFNRNNLINPIPKPEKIFYDGKHTIYGAGILYNLKGVADAET